MNRCIKCAELKDEPIYEADLDKERPFVQLFKWRGDWFCPGHYREKYIPLDFFRKER